MKKERFDSEQMDLGVFVWVTMNDFFGMVLKSKIVVDDGKFPRADRDLSGGRVWEFISTHSGQFRS